MNDSERDVIISEYRHEIVLKFAKDFVEGSIYLDTGKIAQANVDNTAKIYSQLLQHIDDLFSGKLNPTELDETEKKIFHIMSLFRSLRVISEDRLETTKIEQQIENLKARIDSTNNLLVQLLTILKQLVKAVEDGKHDD